MDSERLRNAVYDYPPRDDFPDAISSTFTQWFPDADISIKRELYHLHKLAVMHIGLDTTRGVIGFMQKIETFEFDEGVSDALDLNTRVLEQIGTGFEWKKSVFTPIDIVLRRIGEPSLMDHVPLEYHEWYKSLCASFSPQMLGDRDGKMMVVLYHELSLDDLAALCDVLPDSFFDEVEEKQGKLGKEEHLMQLIFDGWVAAADELEKPLCEYVSSVTKKLMPETAYAWLKESDIESARRAVGSDCERAILMSSWHLDNQVVPRFEPRMEEGDKVLKWLSPLVSEYGGNKHWREEDYHLYGVREADPVFQDAGGEGVIVVNAEHSTSQNPAKLYIYYDEDGYIHMEFITRFHVPSYDHERLEGTIHSEYEGYADMLPMYEYIPSELGIVTADGDARPVVHFVYDPQDSKIESHLERTLLFFLSLN